MENRRVRRRIRKAKRVVTKVRSAAILFAVLGIFMMIATAGNFDYADQTGVMLSHEMEVTLYTRVFAYLITTLIMVFASCKCDRFINLLTEMETTA